jgi:hypothetical protein
MARPAYPMWISIGEKEREALVAKAVPCGCARPSNCAFISRADESTSAAGIVWDQTKQRRASSAPMTQNRSNYSPNMVDCRMLHAGRGQVSLSQALRLPVPPVSKEPAAPNRSTGASE